MDSFANRVDKIFGSLGAGATVSSRWRIREQPQERTTQPPADIPAHDDVEEEPELEAVDDDDDDYDQERPSAPDSCRQFQFLRRSSGPDGMDTEEDLEEEGLQMRSIIGLDTTLDFEEEEDEFDKTAVGREADKERLFMREINEADATFGFSESLPQSLYDLKHVARDPRANHLAAKARLDEDARYAASLQESQRKDIAEYTETAVAQEPKTDLIPCLKRSIEPKDDSNVDSQNYASAGAALEKKETAKGDNDKALKRVRFADNVQQQIIKETEFIRPKSLSQFASQVPDYVRNPSKYTRYTLDWTVEDNEQTNLAAFHACCENIRVNQSTESDDTEGITERIRYIPRGTRIVEDDQKIKLEDTKRMVVHMNRSTMCVDQFEKESETIIESSNIMDTEKVAEFSDSSGGKMAKTPRRYRLKREAETEMELDSPK